MAELEAPVEEKREEERNAAPNIGVDKTYVLSPRGILKIVEFFLLLIAFSACANFKTVALQRLLMATGKADFFLFVTVVGWLYVIVLFVANVVGIMAKLQHKMRDIVIAIGHANFALFLLISSALIADEAVRFARHPSFCTVVPIHLSTSCGAYDTAVAFGLFAMIAFVADAALYFVEWKKYYAA